MTKHVSVPITFSLLIFLIRQDQKKHFILFFWNTTVENPGRLIKEFLLCFTYISFLISEKRRVFAYLFESLVFVIFIALKQNFHFCLWMFKIGSVEEGIIGLGSFGYIWHWMELGA